MVALCPRINRHTARPSVERSSAHKASQTSDSPASSTCSQGSRDRRSGSRFMKGLPDFGECPVVIARVIRAAIRTCDQTLGPSIDTLNLRVYVPLLIRNGVPFFILLRQWPFTALPFIMKSAASLVTGRRLVVRVDMIENGCYLGGNARGRVMVGCRP